MSLEPQPRMRSRSAFEADGHGAYVESYDSDERMIINMGPVHPATHGVLRLVLELDAETVVSCRPIIGYLHTGMEKECEDQNWRSAITIVTRMDYLAPFFNELGFSIAVEQLLGIEVPKRGQYIRVLISEMNRLSSHLVWFGTQGLDMGAISAMFYGFREREVILDFYEMVTGLRMNNNYIIPGGVWEDLPDGWRPVVENILGLLPGRIQEYESLLSENPVFLERTKGIGTITAEECRTLSTTGPIARAAGIDWDLRRDMPYGAYPDFEFDVPTATEGDVYARYKVRMEEMRAVRAHPPSGRRRDARWRLQEHGPEADTPSEERTESLDGGGHPPLQARHPGLHRPGRRGICGGGVTSRRTRCLRGLGWRHRSVPCARTGPVVREPPGFAGDGSRRSCCRSDRIDRVGGPGARRCRQMSVLTDEMRSVAEQIVAKYPNKRSAALPLLFLVQSVEGHVTDSGMRDVADILGLTPAEVLATGSLLHDAEEEAAGRVPDLGVPEHLLHAPRRAQGHRRRSREAGDRARRHDRRRPVLPRGGRVPRDL